MTAIRIHCVGDVGPRRPEPASIFAGAPRLGDCDILFGQMETVLTSAASPAPNARLAMRSPPAIAGLLRKAGFDVMSVAGNHAMDFGADGLRETIQVLQAAGVSTCGGGENLAEARRPAIVAAAGRRIAFLAYSSILPAGYAAEANRAGCAPMWAHTHYEAIEPDQPGTGVRIRTFADPAHLSALLDDVRSARAQADVVVVSMHWGIHFVRAAIADYQRQVAHAAIEAGADMIVGHHPHLLKGVDIYRGKPVFYSLGNFAIEQPSAFREDLHLDAGFREISRLGSGWKPHDAYMLPPETRHTAIAACLVTADGDVEVRIRPHWIDDDSAPHALAPADPRFGEVLDYLSRVSSEAGLSTTFEARGDEIRVTHDG